MSLRSWTSRVTAGLFLFAGVFIFNFLVCHPVDFVHTDSKRTEWTTYTNRKYGYTVEIPSTWSLRENTFGVELFQPETKRFISIKALAEESSLLAIPTDEYALERAPLRHAYIQSGMADPVPVAVSQDIQGYEITPRINAAYGVINEPWYGKTSGDQITATYLPAQFQGDVYCSFVEVFTVGPKDADYERIIQSYKFSCRSLRQAQLMNMRLIDTSETPSPAISYVGETRGFYVDFDGDGVDELLIAGMPRNMEDVKDRCFFRILKLKDGVYQRVFEEKFSENSFHSSDIKMINVDNRFGQDVFLRFVEHGNPWGKNTTAVVFFDGTKFRSAHFGAFGDARDLDGDGVDEIVYTTNSYFSQGAIAAWYDVYAYENGDFVESNARFKNYFRDVILPKYKDQVETVKGELALTHVEKFIQPANQLLRRLGTYIARTEDIAAGRASELR